MEAVFPRRSDISAYNLLTNHHSLPDDGRSISRNVANINILVQDKTKRSFRTFYNMISTESTNIIHIENGMSGQTIISIISTNLGPFGANSGKQLVSQVASDCILQLSKNRIVFLQIRDLENLLFSTTYLKPRIYLFLSTTSFRSTQWPSG